LDRKLRIIHNEITVCGIKLRYHEAKTSRPISEEDLKRLLEILERNIRGTLMDGVDKKGGVVIKGEDL
jgi:hypothetical protein